MKNFKMVVFNSLSVLSLGAMLMAATPASAEPRAYVPGHPRVSEVNTRRDNQDNRIANQYADHNLTNRQVRRLDRQEGRIGQEERDMRSMDAGHLTRADQRSLNQQLNQTNREIYHDAHQSN